MLYILTPIFCAGLCLGTVFSFFNNGNKVYAASTVKSNGAYLNLNGTTNIYNGFEGAQKETIYLGNNNNAPVKWRVLAKNDTKYGSGDNLLLFADSVLGTTVYNDTTYWGDYYGTSKLRAILNGGYHVKPDAGGDVASVSSYIAESSSYASTLFSGLGDDLVMTANDIITHDSHFTRAAWFESPKVNPWLRTVGNDLYTSKASDIIDKYIVYCTTAIAGKSINTKTGKTADPNFSVNYSVANGIAETTKGDKLFPLDYDDMVNAAYGFVDTSGKTYLDKLGSTYASNYASKGYKYGYPGIWEGEVKFAQFKPTGSGSYWLRMAAKVFDSWENGAFHVDANGEISASLYAVQSTGALAVQGVRPAFVLDATKLAYLTTATPTAGSGFVNLTTKQTTPTYKTYVKDADFNTFSSSAKGNVKEDNGTLSITYNNPTGETGGNLLVLLSPKSATGGEVDYQATVAMSPTASATKQAATTLALPAEVSLSTHNLTVLYTSATSANATENIYCAYPADGGIDAPQDFNAGKFNNSSKWIGDLPEGDRPSWWNSDIYGDTSYMSIKSVEYTNVKGVKQTDKTYTTADIKDAGTYKVTFELTSGLKWSGGSTENKSFTISITQAESSIEAQYAAAPTYVPDKLPAISLKAGGTPGTIKWDDGQHPQSGTKSYTWTFTPENENNYTTVKDGKQFTFSAREVESVTIKSFDTKGKTVYTNTTESVLKSYMTVEVKFVSFDETITLDPGDYELQINTNNKLKAGENKIKVKYTTSDNKTKYSAEFPISVEELTYKTITHIGLGKDEFTYPVTAKEILAEITSVDVEMNDGGSDSLTAEQIKTLMLLDGDLTVGTKDVTFKIKDTEAEADYEITINKGTYKMDGVALSGELNPVYDGNAHALTLTGTLPEGVTATISYEKGGVSSTTAPTDAGTYTVTASFTGDSTNYNAVSNKTATLTIAQADYPEEMVFEGDTLPHDGAMHSISATVPEGVTVKYEYNGTEQAAPFEFDEIGSYTIKAKFTHTNGNYKAIDDKEATLVITDKNIYNADNLAFTVTGATGGNGAYTATYSPDSAISFVLGGKLLDKDSKEVTPSLNYTYEKEEDGAWVTVAAADLKGAGTYRVTVSVTTDDPTYADVADKVATLTIAKAQVDMSGVEFKDKDGFANGDEYTIVITGTLPTTPLVSVTYSVEGHDGLKFTEQGEYVFTATFEHDDTDNYDDIKPMTATLTIGDKMSYNVDNLAFTVTGADGGNGVYTATYSPDSAISVVLGGKPVDSDGEEVDVTLSYTYEKEVDGEWVTVAAADLKDAGTYRVTVSVATGDKNYASINDKVATLTIEKADFDMSGVSFEDETKVFDGEAHELKISGDLPDGVTVSYVYDGDLTAVDTYEITAKFTHENPNYNDIDDMTATLTISDAVVESITATGYENEVFTTVNTLDDLKAKLTVTAVYDNGSTEAVTDFELSCDALRDGGKFKFGVQSITVKYISDGNEFTAVVNISVEREKVALPTFKGGLNYTGVTVKPTANDFNGYDSVLMTFVTEKLQSGLNVGSYKAVFALNDSENYEWATATTYKKSVFAAVVYDGETEVILNANEAAVDWNIARAVLTATKTEGALPVFASESFIGALSDVVAIKYYKDEACTEEVAAADLAYETQYYVKAELIDTENFELDTSAAAYTVKSFTYTTPAKQLTLWDKIVKFVVTNWLWLVIAVAALILLIIIIACAARASRKRREREERRLAEEKAERERREEREEQRRREDREERMARLSQQQAMPQMMMPQMMPQQMPMQQAMPQAAQGVVAGSASSSEIAELKAELKAEFLAMKVDQNSKEIAANEIAQLRNEVSAMRNEMTFAKRTDQISGMPVDVLTEALTVALKNVLGGQALEAPKAEQSKKEEAVPVTAQVPPDAIMTTVTTTKIDTTKKSAQSAPNADRAAAPSGRTIVRNFVAPMPVDDGRVFDVGGFYKPADPLTDMEPVDDEKGE